MRPSDHLVYQAIWYTYRPLTPHLPFMESILLLSYVNNLVTHTFVPVRTKRIVLCAIWGQIPGQYCHCRGYLDGLDIPDSHH